MTKKPTYEECEQAVVKCRKAYEALRKSEEMFQSMFYRHNAIMIIIEPESGQIIDANHSAENFYGYTIDKLRTMAIQDINTLSQEEVAIERKRAITEERNYFIFSHRKENGEIRIVEVHSSPIIFEEVELLLSIIHDITERKKFEEKIIKQQYYLQKAQELGQVGTWELDVIKNRLVWTDENCRIFGVPEGSVVDYEIFLEKVHPDHRRYVDQEWKAALEGKPYDIEHPIVVAGKTKWVREKAELEFDENGKAVKAIGFTQDISDLKQSENALRESEAQFRSVFDNTSDSIIITDATGKIAYWNQGSQNIFGYTGDEIIGASIDRLLPEDVKSLKNAGVITHDNHRDSIEFGNLQKSYAKRKDGSVFPVEVTLSSWERDGKYNFCSIIRDITEREKAEKNLALERNQLLSIFDGMDEVIYIADPETYELLYMNGPCMKQWGNGIGKKCHKVLQNLDSPCPFCSNHIIFKENFGSSYVWEWQNKANNRWYRCVDKAIQWPTGKLVRFEMAIDITDLKNAEEQLRQSHKMESVGTLAGGIAHEFNNILGGVFGYLELAREEASGNGPIQESLEEIHRLGMRAKDIVSQILIFSRKDHHKRIAIRLSTVIKEELKMLRATIPATIEIRHSLDDTRDTILADPTQIQQVIINLCVNARDAMQVKGGLLEISLSPVVLDVENIKQYPDLSSGEYVKLLVSDTGSGIAPENIKKIFDPFFTTKAVGEGTGIGLSVVHSIIKDHGGAVTVSSDPGQGTLFTVLLPVTDTAASAKAEEETLPVGTENVLIVDDEDFLVIPQKKILERLGYKVTARTDSLDALELFTKDPHHFDLIITDLTMPKLTGDRLAAAVIAIRPDIPIILSTGYADAADNEKFKQCGIKAFIPKPFQKEALAKILRQILDEK